ncbi:MAG: hypothetical protein QG660_2371 [Pseudomonadota bacterium]|nr:hypothetical protein [Pseudomonadota bacterium]
MLPSSPWPLPPAVKKKLPRPLLLLLRLPPLPLLLLRPLLLLLPRPLLLLPPRPLKLPSLPTLLLLPLLPLLLLPRLPPLLPTQSRLPPMPPRPLLLLLSKQPRTPSRSNLGASAVKSRPSWPAFLFLNSVESGNLAPVEAGFLCCHPYPFFRTTQNSRQRRDCEFWLIVLLRKVRCDEMLQS